MENSLVTVVIPVYRLPLSDSEAFSLRRITRILGRYPLTVIKPASLDLSPLSAVFSGLLVKSFDDAYFNGIAGYNRLMLSADFYRQFTAYRYILIAQLDTYIFRDDLEKWCNKGYDYTGAPWPVRPVYRMFPFCAAVAIKRAYRQLFHLPDSHITDNKIGNGGLSLRKVSSHLQATVKLHSLIDQYLSHRGHLFHEDVFFAVEPNRNGVHFTYPEFIESLEFRFDKYPKLCYRLNRYRMPFGCHGWEKRRMRNFWKLCIFK